MRTYYIFLINKEISLLFKDDTYPLYRSFLKIKRLNKSDLSIGINLFEQIALPIDKNKLGHKIFNYYKDSCFYSAYKYNHSYINKYRDENTNLNINNSYLKIKSNMAYPEFFKYFKTKNNLFACDFDNNDYFWLKNI